MTQEEVFLAVLDLPDPAERDAYLDKACAGDAPFRRQVEDLLAHQDVIIPHLPPERQDPALWFDNVVEPDEDYPEAGDCMGTNTVPSASRSGTRLQGRAVR